MDSKALVQKVAGCVHIAIMRGPTDARPFALLKRQAVEPVAALRAELRRREKPIDNHDVYPCGLALVCELPTDLTQRNLLEARGQLGFRKAANPEVLDGDEVKSTDESSRHPVKKFTASVHDSFVLARQSPSL
jgi:hypothetical protein